MNKSPALRAVMRSKEYRAHLRAGARRSWQKRKQEVGGDQGTMETKLDVELMELFGVKTVKEVDRRLDEMKAQRTIIVWNKYEGSTGHLVYQFVLADLEPGAKK